VFTPLIRQAAQPDSQRVQQNPTVPVSLEKIMASQAFRQGVADVRAGRPPNFDGDFELMRSNADDFINAMWNYERGRQYAVLVSRDLPIILKRKVNPKALLLYSFLADQL
jgi:hypothetical protein